MYCSDEGIVNFFREGWSPTRSICDSEVRLVQNGLGAEIVGACVGKRTRIMSNEITKFLIERIEFGDFPSAVFLVGEKGEIRLKGSAGKAVVEPVQILATEDTIYDLASLTKVLVTGLLTAQLVECGDLALDTEIGGILNQLNSPDKERIVIQELLTHTSRLPAWMPFYLCVDEPSLIVRGIADTPLVTPPSNVIYSDLNFILLGKVIEQIIGKPLDEAFASFATEPLGLINTSFNPSSMIRRRIAASERGNMFERQTCVENGYLTAEGANTRPTTPKTNGDRPAFRTETIWGEVHDGNAYFMNGVAGHAGLFASIDDIFVIANQFLRDRSKLLKPETCELFHTNLTPGRNEHRSFAFQMATTPDSAAGINMSEQAFGHLGFTGTSLWIDPLKERVFILLTNRTHAHGLPFVNLNAVRRRFHDLAIEYLGQNF